jgi:hypothetical protein
MKSKIFALSIATMILWGSTTEPMGRFFRHKSPGFSRVMTGLQWTTLGGLTAYNGYNLKSGLDSADEFFKNLPEASPELTTRVQSVIKDRSVSVKEIPEELRPSFGNAMAFAHPLTGTKCIVLNPDMELHDTTFKHEYRHIQDNHSLKAHIFKNLTPLAVFATFKSGIYGYKIARYGYKAAKTRIPSIWANLLKIPGTYGYILTDSVSAITSSYFTRKYEFQADDAIEASSAEAGADYLERVVGPIECEQMKILESRGVNTNGLSFQLTRSHPPMEDRIERLRERAAQAKA